jgi:hypothetical protein
VERFDPSGSDAAAILIGFGAGRPSWEARFALGAGSDAGSTRDVEHASSAYRGEEHAARERMLQDLAAEAVAFVRRRR